MPRDHGSRRTLPGFPRTHLSQREASSATSSEAEGGVGRRDIALGPPELACRPDRGDLVLGVGPLFHITGIVSHLGIAFCRERIAAYKYPRLVEIIEEVPQGATGKFLRRQLRSR